MRRALDLAALFGTIFVLFAFMLWLRNFEFGAITTIFHPKSLAATGFIILAAFSMGEFFKLLNVPALLGYIAAGVLFGPNLAPLLPNAPEALFSSKVISDLALVNVLTVGVIGTMGGGELKIDDIKENITTVLAVLGVFCSVAIFGTWVTVMLLYDYAPALVPFLEGRPVEHAEAAALILAVFAVAMSPSATLAILQETRAKGRFTSLVLGTVIIADLILVALVLLAIQIDKILLSPEGFTVEALAEQLPHIAAEFGYALVIGLVAGLVFILYLRFIKREQLLFTIFIIFLTAYVSNLLHAETLLAFLTAGFIVQNFSRHGHDMIHALEKISLPVFVIYFMTQAALLDLQAVFGFIGLTVILAVVRGVALFLGGALGTEFAGADATTRRYLWFAFLPRGGVDLVLAALVGQALQPWGSDIQTVIMATVVVHIVAGPPLLKLALDWAGETEGSRRQTEQEAAAFDQLPAVGEVSSIAASFPIPNFEDDDLNARVLELRQILVDLHRDVIVEPLELKTTTLQESLQEAAEELHRALDELEVVLSSDEYVSADERAEAVAQVHIQYLADIADDVETWERINPEIVNLERVFELIASIRNREDFSSVYRVQSEAFLFETTPDDSGALRFVKGLRRVRRALLGPGMRSVPLGRLWRYYVELTVTRLLARAADASAVLNEKFWTDLGNHMRRVDDLFDEIFDAVLGEASSGNSEDEEAAERGAPAALALLAAGREAARQREQALREQLSSSASTALDRYTVSLRETYAKFLSAVAQAGTIELPTWQYRPSSLFDRSRRAEAQVEYRLLREQTVVTGQRGWIVTEYQLVLFLYWLEAYEDRVRDTLGAMIANPVTAQLDVLRSVCTTLPESLQNWESLDELRDVINVEGAENREWPRIDWEWWLNDEIRPSLRRARGNFQRMLALYAQGHAARRLLEILERRVAEFSDEIVLLSEHPDQIAANDVVPTLRIPLREWFVSEVVREAALRLVEFDERGETVIRACLQTLEDIQQVLEFNLLTAEQDAEAGNQAHAVELATGGLDRAAAMIDDLRAVHLRRFADLTAWIVSETSSIAERAAEPFLSHRPAEIERLMSRRGQATLAERGESWATATVNRVASAARGTYRRYAPLAQEVVDEVGALFVEEAQRVENADIRRRLHPDERGEPRIPAIYRRLFTPVPLDIPDFYISRPDDERRIIRALAQWVDGRRSSVLIHGNRGVGKRSTLHHILQNDAETATRLQGIAVHTVVLDDDLETEAELVAKIGAALPNEPTETIEGLSRFLEVVEGRHVIVIEHGEKLYSRTMEGLAMCRRFLRLMNESSDRILWVVLMGTPAVTLLETSLGLLDFFTHTIEIGSLGNEEVEQMIQRRHRVSGFRANFERDRPRIRDWLRHPIDTSDALRDPRAEYFRDLARLSGGNPMRALLYWLETVSLDEADEHLIWVGTLPDTEPRLISSLSLPKRLILASLVQHHTLTPMQMRAILRRDFDGIQTELEHLERLGFIQQIVGRHVIAYQVRPLASELVGAELREMNMI